MLFHLYNSFFEIMVWFWFWFIFDLDKQLITIIDLKIDTNDNTLDYCTF